MGIPPQMFGGLGTLPLPGLFAGGPLANPMMNHHMTMAVLAKQF